MEKASDKISDRIRTSNLLSTYGGLLSEKQHEILRMYFDEDLGFSEIAEELGITRQAVYDATQQGKSALEKYEQQLGIISKNQAEAAKDSKTSLPKGSDSTRDNEKLEKCFQEIEKMASGNIIYDTRKLQSRLKELKDILWPQKSEET